jgi:hypothetical protein
MNTTNNSFLVIAFVVVILLFFAFGGGAMTGSPMHGALGGGMHGSGWMDERSWMWTPTLISLGVGVVLGWVIFKRKV